MDEGVIEVVVSNRPSGAMKFLRVLFIILAVISLFMSASSLVFLAFLLGFGLAAWYVSGRVQIDYEYSLVDRELRVARIANKEKRKHLGTYDLDKMEILAPANSYHLDDYKNRTIEHDLDYSDHEKGQDHPAGRYYLYLEGSTRIALTLQGDEAKKLLDSVRQFAPRKVFFD
ncbi:MAG: hypothetical protein ACI4OJ_09120 [Lachnospiraceae bacterium]